MRIEFGGKSKLNGKIMRMYPTRCSYVPNSEDGLEEYVFVYEPWPLKIEHCTEGPVSSKGDFLTPRIQTIDEAGGLFLGHIYPVVNSEFIPAQASPRGCAHRSAQWNFSLDAGAGHDVVLSFDKLAYAIPGPLTEPSLYKDAEVSVDPTGEVTLHYKDLGVKVRLMTIAADDKFREENQELVAQNELFVVNNV